MNIHKFISLIDENDDLPNDDDDEDEDESFILLKFLRARQSCILAALNKNKNKNKTNTSTSTSKTDAVVAKIAERKENGKNKIVFCHYRGEIDFIKKNLEEKHKMMNVKVIDGRTPERERRIILQQATAVQQATASGAAQATAVQQATSAKVLILQIQTGCEGLNLQEYSEVYFVSPHWNPAVEDQAIARCYRIGQKEETQVFRFYMNGFNPGISLDQYVYEAQVDKKGLVSKLLW